MRPIHSIEEMMDATNFQITCSSIASIILLILRKRKKLNIKIEILLAVALDVNSIVKNIIFS
jgi:hypothetical protein